MNQGRRLFLSALLAGPAAALVPVRKPRFVVGVDPGAPNSAVVVFHEQTDKKWVISDKIEIWYGGDLVHDYGYQDVFTLRA